MRALLSLFVSYVHDKNTTQKPRLGSSPPLNAHSRRKAPCPCNHPVFRSKKLFKGIDVFCCNSAIFVWC
eukprot:scaffold2234_cov165-Amphora_coffeaeformis.AAC.5